jgi:transcriptional regulator with XRE-family HTH domain
MRRRRGLTQAALAERTGRTQSQISAVEKGIHDPRASTLAALASALGCEWILVPRERAREALRSAGLTGQPASPPTVLEEVFVPDPEDGDAG